MNKTSKDSKFTWAVPHFFLRFNSQSVDVFCLNLHRFAPLETRLMSVLSSRDDVVSILTDPFVLYTHILNEWSSLSSTVFWKLRKEITKLEDDTRAADYKVLHTLAKHINQQANEVAQHSLAIVMAIQSDHEALLKESKSRRPRRLAPPRPSDTDQELGTHQRPPAPGSYTDEDRFQECQENTASMLKALVLTMKLNLSSYVTLEKRVSNQINLVSIFLGLYIRTPV